MAWLRSMKLMKNRLFRISCQLTVASEREVEVKVKGGSNNFVIVIPANAGIS